jgi:hypothetical protein
MPFLDRGGLPRDRQGLLQFTRQRASLKNSLIQIGRQ